MLQRLKSVIFSYICILIIHYMLKHYLMNNQEYILDDIYDEEEETVEPLETEEEDSKVNSDPTKEKKNDLSVGACGINNDLDSFMKNIETGDIPDPFNQDSAANLEIQNDTENPYLENNNMKDVVENAKTQSKDWQNENNIMNGGELFEGVTGFDDFDTYSSFQSI